MIKKKKFQSGGNAPSKSDSTGTFVIQEYDNPKYLKGISQMASDSLKAGAWTRDGTYIGNAPKSGKVKRYRESDRAYPNATSRQKYPNDSPTRRNGGKVKSKKK